MRIIPAKDYADLSRKAANIISAQIILKETSVLGLATGSTPLGVYRQLIEWYRKKDLDFFNIKTVNLDEYCGLTPDHPQSYHCYMKKNFFNHINIDPQNTHLPDGMASDIAAECARYENLIAGLGGIDLQILGLGHDGHIGFNEPDNAFEKITHCVELEEATIQANARFFGSAADVPRKAITMGIKTIMQAHKLLLVVSGADKKDILFRSLCGAISPDIPASILQLHPQLTVVADSDALSAFGEHRRVLSHH